MTNPISGSGAIPAPLPAPVPFPIRPVPAPSPDQPPLTWRNMLCDVSGDRLLLIAPAAGLEKAAELDGELLTCCARAATVDREADAVMDEVGHLDNVDPGWLRAVARSGRMIAEWNALVRRAARLQAWTPEGLRAKAVLATNYLRHHADEVDMGLSLARDIVGRAQA